MKTLFAATALLLAPALAFADPDQGTRATSGADRRDHSRIAATAGVATPNGTFGVEYAHAVSDHVELSAGLGWSVLSGPQAALMPRLRTRLGAMTFSVGAGFSGGHYKTLDFDGNGQNTNALWANAEVGVQVGSRRGPFARLFVGAGVVALHDEIDIHPDGMDGLETPWLPYLGLAVGDSL
jgi:hypothetical protein